MVAEVAGLQNHVRSTDRHLAPHPYPDSANLWISDRDHFDYHDRMTASADVSPYPPAGVPK